MRACLALFALLAGCGGDTQIAKQQIDADSDGYTEDVDCDDAHASVNPDAPEACNGRDDDCDGAIDEDASDTATWYYDGDGDGYGDPDVAAVGCEPDAGYVADASDCDDAAAAVNPGATEVCDGSGADEDCDGLADDADGDVTGTTTWRRDADGDGWASEGGAVVVSCGVPDGYVAPLGDCDDDDDDVNPGATEACDAADTDEDCDGLADEADTSATGTSTWYRDADADGHAGTTSTLACDAPDGYLATSTDCDDTTAARSPSNAEVCDAANLDEDCDSAADDADTSATGKATWYRDADADTLGGPTSTTACDLPSGYVATSTDCDDTDAGVGLTRTWYRDADADGYGSDVTTSVCAEPSGYVADTSDCDDGHADAFPGGVEVCGDGVDQDCSGADETCPVTGYDGGYDVDDAYGVKLYGIATSDTFGESVAYGDFNGDGEQDLLVGASGQAYWGSYTGVAYGVSGPLPAGANVVTDVDAFMYYNSYSAYDEVFGWNVHGIGDVDEDGRDDMIVNLSYFNGYLYLGGQVGNHDYQDGDDGSYGCITSSRGGPFDAATGVDEWFCANVNYGSSKGGVYVYSGMTTTTTAALIGETTDDYAGGSVAGEQDIDGDGLVDVWVGAYGDDDAASMAGAAYLVYGPVTGTFSLSGADEKITGAAFGDQFGTEVKSPGDVDGDGAPDLLAACRLDDTAASNAGAIYLFTEPASGPMTSVYAGRLLGENANDYTEMFDAGDFDGDGHVDVIVGSFENDSTATNAGAVWLVYGPFSGTIQLGAEADAEWLGSEANDLLGSLVTALPDMDGDGDQEIAMSAPYADERGYTDRGALYIWWGE